MKIRSSFLALALCSVAALTATPAKAQGLDLGPAGTIAGTAGIMSDYVFRGVSQTRGGPALQGGLEWTKELGIVTPYAGTFLSNVTFPDVSSNRNLDADYEWDIYGGLRLTPIDKLVLDAGYISYQYPRASYPAANSMSLSWNEYYGKGSYDFGFAKLSLGWYHAKNYSVGGGKANYYTSQIDVPLPIWDLTATAHYGALKVANENNLGLPDYKDWSLGVSRTFEQIWGTTWAVTYYDTDVKRSDILRNNSDGAFGPLDNRMYNTVSPRVVLAVTKAF